MPDVPVPTLVAMLLCDTVIQDAITTKKSLIGIFGQVNALAFPTTLNATVFARLTDAEGKYRFRLDIVNLTDNKTILSLPSPNDVVAASQLQYVELVLTFQGLLLPSAGKYEFQLWANDAYLGRTTMEAIRLKQS